MYWLLSFLFTPSGQSSGQSSVQPSSSSTEQPPISHFDGNNLPNDPTVLEVLRNTGVINAIQATLPGLSLTASCVIASRSEIKTLSREFLFGSTAVLIENTEYVLFLKNSDARDASDQRLSVYSSITDVLNGKKSVFQASYGVWKRASLLYKKADTFSDFFSQIIHGEKFSDETPDDILEDFEEIDQPPSPSDPLSPCSSTDPQ